MGASSRVKRDDRGITNYDIRSVGGESEEIYLFPREALIQMLKAMRAQDKKEAQAAQAQDRVRLECICPFGDFGGITSDARNENGNQFHKKYPAKILTREKTNSPQKLDDIDGKVNAVGKSVEKKIDMISTYLIRYFIFISSGISDMPTYFIRHLYFTHPPHFQDEQQD